MPPAVKLRIVCAQRLRAICRAQTTSNLNAGVEQLFLQHDQLVARSLQIAPIIP